MENKKETPAVTKVERNISDMVLAKVNEFRAVKAISLPADYSAENALKMAFLQLSEMTVDKGGQKTPVLQYCTQPSIANALLKMVTQGLNPMKRQCSFIPYNNELTCVREYQGSIALAKRYGLKYVTWNAIYEGDDFSYAIDSKTGRKEIIAHKQNFESIDISKIRGAYCITEMEDGTRNLEIMNMSQIRNSWNQGAMKGNSGAHKNFTDQMCFKTVINRACKGIINSSDDSNLYSEDDDSPSIQDLQSNANKETITLQEVDQIQEPEVITSEELLPKTEEAKVKKEKTTESAEKKQPNSPKLGF